MKISQYITYQVQLIKCNMKSMNSCKLSTNYGLFLIERKHVFSRKDLASLTFVHSSRYISSGSSQTDVQHQGTGHQCATVGWRQESKAGKHYKTNLTVRAKSDTIDRFAFQFHEWEFSLTVGTCIYINVKAHHISKNNLEFNDTNRNLTKSNEHHEENLDPTPIEYSKQHAFSWGSKHIPMDEFPAKLFLGILLKHKMVHV